ncbi:MAG: recombinase family protein [Chloroflexota bacterium]|nr:recombinase family protein [Chloroflexota bacterium]
MNDSRQPTPAALYARVSSDRQDVDLSVAAQLRALRDFAERNGFVIAREYIDEAESGRVADRPQFRKMLDEAAQPNAPFQEILVWKFSRFTRKREHAVAFKSMLRRRGIRVTSITEHADDTPTGKLMEAIIESVDEFYSENLAQEVTRGMREAAARGFFLGSRAPYGYTRVKVLDGGKERPTLEIDPATEPIVKEMFERSARGQGLKEICQDLHERGITKGGKRWQKNMLHYVLTNEAYTGTAVWGKTARDGQTPDPVRVADAWPAIVSRELYDAVQAGLRARAPKIQAPARVGSKFLLSGLLRCGVCDKPYTGQSAKSGQFAYYVCNKLLREGAGACDGRYLNAGRMEDQVVAKIMQRILNQETITELVQLVAEEVDALAQERASDLAIIESDLEDVRRRLEKLYDAIENSDLTYEALSPRIIKLRQQEDQLAAARDDAVRQLEQRRADLPSTPEIKRYVADFREFLQTGTIPERKALIRNFVQGVKIDGDEVSIRYTIPMPSDGATQDRESVLDFVQSGPPTRTDLRTPLSSPSSARSDRPIGLSSGMGIV